MALASTPDVLERFLSSPIAKQAEAEFAKETAAKRANAAAELAQAEADIVASQRTLDKRLEPIHRAIERAREEVRRLEQNAFDALCEVNTRQIDFNGQAHSARTLLLSTADPAISATIVDLRDAMDVARASFVSQDFTDNSYVEPKRVVRSNAAQIDATVTKIKTAISTLEALKLCAENPGPVVAKIRQEFHLGPLS